MMMQEEYELVMTQEEFFNSVLAFQADIKILLIVIGVAICSFFIYVVYQDMFGR